MTRFKLLKNRWALSTVVTTLIILVVSVLLATVVVFYAINVVSTRVQEESLTLTKQHIWVNATAVPGSGDCSVASLMVINTGGRDVVIDRLSVRGQVCPWNQTADTSNEKFVVYCTTTDAIVGDMTYVPKLNFTSTSHNYCHFGTTKQYNFTVATNPPVLKSGSTMLIYIVNPDSISVNDVGLTASITLFTAQAAYYKETNVEAVSSS